LAAAAAIYGMLRRLALASALLEYGEGNKCHNRDRLLCANEAVRYH